MKKKLFALILAIVFVGSFAQTWTIYNTSNSSLPNNFITAISQDASNNLWVGSYNKITQQGNASLVKIETDGTPTTPSN